MKKNVPTIKKNDLSSKPRDQSNKCRPNPDFKTKISEICQQFKPKKKLSNFVKWPKYIRIQRQRRILSERLKIPNLINQFTRVLNLNLTKKIFKILAKYQLKTKNFNKSFKNSQPSAQPPRWFTKDFTNIQSHSKAPKLVKQWEKNNFKKNVFILKHGINTVTNLIRRKKALFVLIANDVNPIEMVMWLPSLCKKLGVPFCIIKNKQKLGSLVNRKKTSCLAVESIFKEDKSDVTKIIDCFKFTFDQKFENIKK